MSGWLVGRLVDGLHSTGKLSFVGGRVLFVSGQAEVGVAAGRQGVAEGAVI